MPHTKNTKNQNNNSENTSDISKKKEKKFTTFQQELMKFKQLWQHRKMKVNRNNFQVFLQALKENDGKVLAWIVFYGVSDVEIKLFAEVLRHDCTLQKLTLYFHKDTQISAEGIKELAAVLKQNNALQDLVLTGKPINDEGAKTLLDALKNNQSLCTLYLPRSISPEISSEIEKCLERNRKLRDAATHNNSTQLIYSSTSPKKRSSKTSHGNSEKQKQPSVLIQTLTRLDEDYTQGREHVTTDLQRLEQQQSHIEESLKNIEQQLKMLQPSATVKTNNTNVDPVQVQSLQEEINQLKQQQAELLTEQAITIAKRKAIEGYKTQPNLWLFYRTFTNRLEAAFIGIKSGSYEFFEHNSHTKLDKTTKGITVIGKVLSRIPAIGNILDTPFSAVATATKMLDQERLGNLFKTLSNLDSLANITLAIEATAHVLVERYNDQLLQLLELEEVRKQRSIFSKNFHIAKNTLLNAADLSPAEQVAEFAVSLIVSELLEGTIHWDKPLEQQFIKTITLVPSTLETMKQAIFTQIGANALPTRENKDWELQHFYRKPGIKVKNSDGTYSYYANHEMDPDVYGYRLGTQQEVDELRLFRKRPPTEKKKENIITNTTTHSSNTYATISYMMPPITFQPENLAHKKEVEKLQQQVETEKTARQQQEETLRQQQQEIERLKKQMEQLQQTQDDINMDVSGDTQVLWQAKKVSQQSSSQYTSPRHVHQQHSEHEQRLTALEIKMAQVIEQEGDISTEKTLPINEEERAALLGEQSLPNFPRSPSSSPSSISQHFSNNSAHSSKQLRKNRAMQPMNVEESNPQNRMNCGGCTLI